MAFDWLSSQGAMPADGGIQQNEEMLAAAQEEQMRHARMVHSVFNTPTGREFLAFLDDVTIRAPLMQVTGSLVQGEVALSPSDWAYIREGQNSVTRYIQDQIALAENPPKLAETETEGET